MLTSDIFPSPFRCEPAKSLYGMNDVRFSGAVSAVEKLLRSGSITKITSRSSDALEIPREPGALPQSH